jgi:lambda repressor-like predicted transcriptional regulator
MGVQRTKAQWEEMMEEYKKSGQTMASWCRENGVNAKTMGNHMSVAGKNTPKKCRTIDEWRDLYEKQKSSGMSLTGWCRVNGINENTMWTAVSRLTKFQKSGGKFIEQDAAASEWVSIKIPETTRTVSAAELKAYTPDVFPESSVSKQKLSGRDCITMSAGLPPDSEKDAYMRIRLKNFEIEVNVEYPVEKLMILMKGLTGLC